MAQITIEGKGVNPRRHKVQSFRMPWRIFVRWVTMSNVTIIKEGWIRKRVLIKVNFDSPSSYVHGGGIDFGLPVAPLRPTHLFLIGPKKEQ